MNIFAFQPALRPALPTVYGPLDYRTQRELFERMDRILAESNLDAQFLDMAIQAQGIDVTTISPKAAARFALFTAVCLRSNVARILLGLAHRPFVARLADSPLLQWFLQVGEVDEVCVFAKSTSDRVIQPGSSPPRGNHESAKSSNSLTGEPDAGEPPVRFGRRGGE